MHKDLFGDPTLRLNKLFGKKRIPVSGEPDDIDYGGSWSFFTRFLVIIFYLIQLLLTTHLIESLDSLNRAQISG